MNGRVLVIGGGGFLGRVFCRRMAGHAPVIACDSEARLARLEDERIGRQKFNYGQDAAEVIACEQGDTAVIFSWRGYPAAHEKEPLRHLNRNLEHTLGLVTRLTQRGVARVIYASTGGAVYGHCGDALVTEDAKPDPVGFYGIGKLAAEMYVRKAATEAGCDYSIMRIGNAYGPGQLEDNLSVGFVARAVEAALHDGELTVWGPDEVYRDYIHAEDVASAFAAVAVKTDVRSGIYNVGCGRGYSGREVVRLVEESLGRGIRMKEKPAREFDVRRVSLDTSSLRQQTGWEPAFSLGEGIADLAKAAAKLR